MGFTALSAFVALATGVLIVYRRWKNTLPLGLTLPPGPEPLPIIGNSFDIDRKTPWLTYTTWVKQYGPLVRARILGRDVIIFNSEELVQQLVDKRSSIYNDRPHYVTNEFFGVGFNSGFLPYGDQWRLHRRLMHQTLRAAAMPCNIHPVVHRKQGPLVKAIVTSPDECLDILHTYTTSVIMAVVYGYETQPKGDRLVNAVDRVLKFTMQAMTPEREAVAYTFPIIKYIPTWIPGSQYRRDALQCRVYCEEMLEAPFKYTVDAMASGDAPSSMVADLLSNYASQEDYDTIREAIKNSASTVFGGGSGTIDTAILYFVLAMLLYPDVQRRAQEKIDKVIGPDRLPHFDDRPSLSYIDAIVRELWRWRPPSPLGIPHATSESDTYGGYYIPKGAMVIINIWAMSRSDKYPEPEVFRPERFLTESGALTEDRFRLAFGAGRRKCVGEYFADATVWLTVATLLSCFEFRKVEEGWGIENVQWTNGVTVSPHPFPFKLTIRDRAKTVSAAMGPA